MQITLGCELINHEERWPVGRSEVHECGAWLPISMMQAEVKHDKHDGKQQKKRNVYIMAAGDPWSGRAAD